jgi:fructokinase
MRNIGGEQHVEVLSIGETLIDLISDTEQGSLGETRSFHMYPGGQATNVALNVSRLGASVVLVARVGDDAFGSYLRHHLETAGVGTAYLSTTPRTPTTLVVATRHNATPDFAVYRGADVQLIQGDMPLSLLPVTSLVHTSAFALSREPSRSTVLRFVKRAHEAGCLISFDPNYHPRLWEMHDDPASVFARICRYVSLTKPSLDDCIRLFGAGQTPETYAARFLAWGAQQVVLTMGSAGVLLANATGTVYYPTPQVDVVDVTGAGDSFWAGLLVATLDGYAMPEAIGAAQAVAAIKVQQVGPLSQTIDRAALYARIGLQKDEIG